MTKPTLRLIDLRRPPKKERPLKSKPLLILPADPDPLRTTRVYMFHMETTEYYKIGISKNIKSRLATVQNGCPIRVRLYWASERYIPLVDARNIEGTAHLRYRDNRSTAPTQREWFAFDTAGARAVARELTAAFQAHEVTIEQRHANYVLAETIQTVDVLPDDYDVARRYILRQGYSPNDYPAHTVSRYAGQYCKENDLPVLHVRIVPERETYKPQVVRAYPKHALDDAMGAVIADRYQRQRR